LLAYSSVENIGIVLLGLGLALLGRSAGRPGWGLLGLAACVLHVWSHALFKPLLFFAAGSAIHAAGTRVLDGMGGLLRALPRTGLAFAVGGLAVCALPPLAGFVSEFVLYVALFSAWADPAGTTLPGIVIPALALAGGVALVAFAKAFGMAFLGTPRRDVVASG